MCLTGFSTVRKEESLGCIVPTTTADAVASGNEKGEKKFFKNSYLPTIRFTRQTFNSGILPPWLLSFLPTALFLRRFLPERSL